MRLSLACGCLMLGGKWFAYHLTGSAAILSDALESVVHVAAVAFAYYSVKLAHRPATKHYHYGYERIVFFSAGFEGAMIILAAFAILYAAVDKWLAGIPLDQAGLGALLTLAASLVNLALGLYLVRTGRRVNSLILEADGKHVLTDSWTSFGVVAGLGLVALTGWKVFDPLMAIAVGLNILWDGGKLIRRSVGGLLDYADPQVGEQLRRHMETLTKETGVYFHELRYRDTGRRLHAEVHLLFPYRMQMGNAHRVATEIERRLPELMGREVDLVTHLESVEDHSSVHAEGERA
jgi:cation diffusion facilitator family transporter